MINKILLGLIKLVISLVSIVMTPINALVNQYAPDISTYLSNIANFFGYITQYIGWGISLTGLSADTLTIIVIYFTFKLTAPLLVYVIKLALKWYRKLMP